MPTLGKVIIASGLICLVVGLAIPKPADGSPALAKGVLILSGIAECVVGFLLMRRKSPSQVWNLGEIVPALVTREAESGGMGDEALGRLGAAVMPGGGIARAAFGSAQAQTLEYVKDGRRQLAVADGIQYTQGTLVWLVLYQGAHLLPLVAPPGYADLSPPPEVRAWLTAALDAARQSQRQFS